MRAEMEKVLQEQKLEKIRREFERAKIEDRRKMEHDRWVEEQQKAIIEAKLQMAAMENQEPEYIQQEYEEEQPYYEQMQQSMPIPYQNLNK